MNVRQELKRLGEIPGRTAAAITASPFCIGCETLDRQLWEPAAVFPFLAGLPVKHARLQTGWSRCEQQPGVYDFAWLDASVDGLNAVGIRPFLNVGYGNALYAPMGADGIGCHPLYSEAGLAAWKAYVAALAAHVAGRVSAFEIWNEPNVPGTFWQPAAAREPERYARLFDETAPLIRAAAPAAKIVGGVISCMDYGFTRQFLAAIDPANLDVFSFHPYRAHPERLYHRQVRMLRGLVAEYAPRAELWQAEFGYPSMPGSSGYPGAAGNSETIQAKVLLRKLLDDCGLGLALAEWFLAVDLHDYPKGSGRVNSKGLLRARPEVAPKAAYHALRHLGSIVHGAVKPALGALHAPAGEGAFDAPFVHAFLMANVPERTGISTVNLDVNGSPVAAYWRHDVLGDETPAAEITLIHQRADGRGFADPVLCDLLSGAVYALSGGIHQRLATAAWEVDLFRNLPLHDAPMAIVERATLAE